MQKALTFALVLIVGSLSLAKFSEAGTAQINQDVPLKTLLKDKKITSLRAIKSERRLEVLGGDEVLKSYQIALGANPKGHKLQEGDKKTPEGIYTINAKNAASRFHKNLGISYPNAADRARAKARGVSPGGDIKIHGIPNQFSYMGKAFLKFGDWTDGCISVMDDEIDELYELVPLNTRIEILP